jgi:hypothetical protein
MGCGTFDPGLKKRSIMRKINAGNRWGQWVWLLTVLAGVTLRGDPCWVCGKDALEIVIMTDKVTQDKRWVCTECAKLKTWCALCGLPAKEKFTELPDGRVFCHRDAAVVVIENEDAQAVCAESRNQIDQLFGRFTTFPRTNVTLEMVDRRRMEQLIQTPGFDRQCPSVNGYVRSRIVQGGSWQHPISVMNGVTRGHLLAVSAHEYAHAWVRENVPLKRNMDRDSEEGFCELVGYRVAEALGETEELKSIKGNRYTDGQFQLFLDAENTYGFYAVLQWMKWGTDPRLLDEAPDRVRHLTEKPDPTTANPQEVTRIVVGPTPVPDKLTLIGILGSGSHRLALVNDCSLGVGESGKVRYGTNKTVIRCVEIRTNSVVVEVGGERRREELPLKGS